MKVTNVTESSIKTQSLHPRVCRDCFLLSQSQWKQHIPSLFYWIENHSLCFLLRKPLFRIQYKVLLLPASSFLCRVLLRVWASHKKTIPGSVTDNCFNTRLTDTNEQSFWLMHAGTRVVQQQISVLKGCHKPPKSSYTALEGGFVTANPEVMCRGDMRSH